MTSRDFCFWLQGFFEIRDAECEGTRSFPTTGLNEGQAKCIRAHLKMVFAHEIDPSMGPQSIQEELNALHGPNALMRC